MNIEIIKSQLKRFDPIFLSGEDEKLRIIEKSSQATCDVTLREFINEEQIVVKVESILSTKPNSNQGVPTNFLIHLFSEAIALDGIDKALVILADTLGLDANTGITINHDEPTANWLSIQTFIKSLRERLSRPKDVNIKMVAPFGEFRETEMAVLFDLGLRIRFAGGWTKGYSLNQTLLVNTEVLRRFSEFGFRTPIEWYVHGKNMQVFEEQIKNLLIVNFNSGFSLPLISQNPYYQFQPNLPSLPDALEYCQFLSRSYKQYPHYDDVFSPLDNLAFLIKYGGLHRKLNIPTVINFIIHPDGQIGLYRHSPALAHPWTTVSEILSASSQTLRDSLLNVVNNAWSVENVPYCRECQWRYICGGLDVNSDSHLARDDMDTMCGHRKLFLEHFATLRAADYTIEANPTPVTI